MTGPMTWADATPQRVSARMTAGRILRAELTKLTTMRSNWIAGLFAIVASGGVAALNTAGDASNWHSVTAAERVGFDPIQSALFSVIVGALTFGSLGARSISAEYSTGMIRVSLAAMHHRSQVVLSKAALIAAYGFAIGIASNIAALAVGSAVFDAKGLDLPLDNWENVVAVVLGALAVSRARSRRRVTRHSATPTQWRRARLRPVPLRRTAVRTGPARHAGQVRPDERTPGDRLGRTHV